MPRARRCRTATVGHLPSAGGEPATGNGGYIDITTGEVLAAGVNRVGRDLNVTAPLNNFRRALALRVNRAHVLSL